VRGSPIHAGGRVFQPEALVTTIAAREATLGAASTRLAGMWLRRVRPVALIEHTPTGERRHPIPDPARRGLLGMAVLAAATPLILNALAGQLSVADK
jgi:hypothetical protein